jgi:flagellar basal body rod protein FlgG
MFRGIYSAATGMDAAMRHQEITADNLAHLSVPGFRQRGLSFETFDRALVQAAAGQGAAGTQIARGYTDFTPGGLQHTGTSLDVALSGDGFFTIQGPEGPLYTRDGVFQRGTRGELLTTGGYAVLGSRGPISVPPNATSITIGNDGTVASDGVPLDRLRLTSFSDPRKLIPAGTTLFEAPADADPRTSTATVVQGAREQSNVQPANEMVELIRETRFFEAAQRAARALSEAVQLVTKP